MRRRSLLAVILTLVLAPLKRGSSAYGVPAAATNRGPLLTLLWKDPIDLSGFAAVATGAGGIVSEHALVLDRHRFGVQLTSGVYAGAKPDLRMVSPGFPLGSACVAISMPQPLITTAWTAHGWARELLRWIRKVRNRITGVVIHPAGDVVLDIAAFDRRAGDLDAPSSRPFTAFLDLGLDAKTQLLSSYGMASFGLPEVHAAVSSVDDDVEFDRAHEAVLLACYRMSRDERVPSPGQKLRVPVGLEVGSGLVEDDNPDMNAGAAMTWTVRVGRDDITLSRDGELLDPEVLWQASRDKPIGYAAYRRMLLHGLQQSFDHHEVARESFFHQRSPVPPNEVRVYRRSDGRYLLTTCGYGRVRQRGGIESKGSAYLELAIELSDHHPKIAKALSMLGMMIHARPPGGTPIVPGDRMRLEMFGLDRFLFLPLTVVTPKHGPAIHLLSPLALTKDEYASVTRKGSFDPADYDQRVRDRWLSVVGKAL